MMITVMTVITDEEPGTSKADFREPPDEPLVSN